MTPSANPGATKLERLLISEVSGVDDPANEVPGWLVAKSAGAPCPEDERSAVALVAKIKALFSGKEDEDMTKDELNTELDARFSELGKSLAAQLAKSVEVLAGEGATGEPAAPAAPAEAAAAEPAVSITVEDVAKAFEDGIQPVLEVIDKTLDRLERIERAMALATRKSIDGQEDEPTGTSAKPGVREAITKALLNPSSGPNVFVAREKE